MFENISHMHGRLDERRLTAESLAQESFVNAFVVKV